MCKTDNINGISGILIAQFTVSFLRAISDRQTRKSESIVNLDLQFVFIL